MRRVREERRVVGRRGRVGTFLVKASMADSHGAKVGSAERGPHRPMGTERT